MDRLHRNLPNDWTRVIPDDTNPVIVHNFDDANEKYKQYDNCWIVFGMWKGKIALYNGNDENVIIQSISEWKTCDYYDQDS
jgi:hypothetical protein